MNILFTARTFFEKKENLAYFAACVGVRGATYLYVERKLFFAQLFLY